jgi:peptide/nickel transport system permease protein
MAGMYWFDWNPRLGWTGITEDPYNNLQMLFWPAVIGGYSAIVTKARMLRSTLLEVLKQDYIRTAHAKGLKGWVVTYRHAMKNALLPVVTVIGISFAGVIGGSVIMERIFNLPGVGNYLVEGMNQRDYPVVQSLVTFFATWIVLVNLIVDLTYGWIDPRIRLN